MRLIFRTNKVIVSSNLVSGCTCYFVLESTLLYFKVPCTDHVTIVPRSRCCYCFHQMELNQINGHFLKLKTAVLIPASFIIGKQV